MTLSQAHQLLLAQFTDPREIHDSAYLAGHSLEEWEAALRQPLPSAIGALLSQGLLQEAALEDALASILKVPEIKDLLRQHSLPVSGKKTDLVHRLAQADLPLATSLAKGHIAYKSTEQGRRLISQFREAAHASRTSMEMSVIDLLARADFAKAVTTLASFEADQVFPRGMGVNWAHYDSKRDEAVLRLIFTRVPRASADARPEHLLKCRIGAGMLLLTWNVGQVSTWLSQTIPGEHQDRLFKIASDLHSHALFLETLDSLNPDIGARLHVSTANDQLVCASCKALAEREYDLNRPPEIPNPECSSEWCRCSCTASFL